MTIKGTTRQIQSCDKTNPFIGLTSWQEEEEEEEVTLPSSFMTEIMLKEHGVLQRSAIIQNFEHLMVLIALTPRRCMW